VGLFISASLGGSARKKGRWGVYGKAFASMYEGSMVGSGPVVFSVWGYCIAKADIDGTVLLNPQLLAPVIGTSRAEIEDAIRFLEAPDEHSKNPDHGGRRLLRQTGHLYFVVSHAIYREMKSNAERREYMRKYMQDRRSKDGVNVNTVNGGLTTVNPASASPTLSPAGIPEGECKGGENNRSTGVQDLLADFDVAWKAYPDKSGKERAKEAYQKHRAAGDTQADILAGIERYMAYVAAKRAGGQDLHYRNGQTFFYNANWRDEWTVAELTPIGTPQKAEKPRNHI
jgi:hypothetical protein